jgi:hypothetical protein
VGEPSNDSVGSEQLAVALLTADCLLSAAARP